MDERCESEKTFIIDKAEDKLIQISTSNEFERKSISPNTEKEYKFVSIGPDFIPSNSIVKKLKTKDTRVVFAGFKDYSAFDEDPSTTYTIGYTGGNSKSKVTWDRDISGEVLYVKASVGWRGAAEFRFIDKNGNALKFYKNDNTYPAVISMADQQVIEFKAVVPKEAVAIEFFSHYGYYGGDIYVTSIEVVDKTSSTSAISDINDTSTKYIHSANWKQDASVVSTYVVDEKDNFIGVFKGNSFELKSLAPSTTKTYKFVSFNKDFVPSTEVSRTFKTKSAEVNFSGLNYAAFDEDDSTHVGLGYRANEVLGKVTWDKDIAGRTLKIRSSVSWRGSAIFRFVDEKGMVLPFEKDGTLTSQVDYWDQMTVDFNAKVPEGAVAIEFYVHYGYYGGDIYVNSIHLVE